MATDSILVGNICHSKGYKLVITYFLGLLAKYNYSASVLYCTVFCLQSSEVGYIYYVPFDWVRRSAILHSTIVNDVINVEEMGNNFERCSFPPYFNEVRWSVHTCGPYLCSYLL